MCYLHRKPSKKIIIRDILNLERNNHTYITGIDSGQVERDILVLLEEVPGRVFCERLAGRVFGRTLCVSTLLFDLLGVGIVPVGLWKRRQPIECRIKYDNKPTSVKT